ncbi:MAG TPA: DNA polymerase III subunit gamma/tau [Flavobacteriaceae bacterium]|nr:DNA polymerase III subunit gamma/tau [Flavobacteriaceae bacterium]
MEHFVVSARKYRPETFEDVVGQQAITNTLQHAIENDHLAQALLFTGPRGVGKTTCARILAKKINQAETEKPDEDFAFNIFELDAASNNSVDDIRNLIDQVRIPPQIGKYKVYIIDEVHMLSQAAFNAFLKTLEEPPKHTIFILATTEKHKIIPTILSRCQIFDFKRIGVSDAKNYLAKIAKKEGVQAEDDALHIIAQKADGAMRDALSIYDRVVSFSGNNLTRAAVAENLNVLDFETYFTSTDLILENDIPELLLHFNTVLSQGFDGQHFIAGLASHFRDLLVCKDSSTIKLLEVGEQTKTRYFEQSQKTSHEFLLQGIELANETDFNYKNSRNQRLLVELCLMQLASITFDGEKKKTRPVIIPASNFVSKQASPEKNSTEKKPEQVLAKDGATSTVSEVNEPSSEEHAVSEKKVKPTITLENKTKTSGLSLKSIQRKKELLAKQKEKQPISEIRNEPYTETQVLAAWDDYAKHVKAHGNHNLASIIGADLPTLKGDKIHLEMPTETMKLELQRAQGTLLGFIRKKIKNNNLELEIQVNEKAEKKYVFTAREKYEKLKEKNPLLEKLRRTFDLDV